MRFALEKTMDRELLELAAKAAGKKWREDFACYLADDGGKWNPLNNDSDALRLAVKCGIIIEYRREVHTCFAYQYALNLEVMQSNDQLDPYAATRRAIVRAAAEIGRAM